MNPQGFAMLACDFDRGLIVRATIAALRTNPGCLAAPIENRRNGEVVIRGGIVTICLICPNCPEARQIARI